MLHKIEVSELELGMFIESMDGSWFENPFWRLEFLLQKPKQLATLIDSGIAWVTIDDILLALRQYGEAQNFLIPSSIMCLRC